MRISDWSSDVCSSDLAPAPGRTFTALDQIAGMILLCRLFFALLRPHIPTDTQALAMIRRHLLPLLLVQLMLLPLAACAQSATGPVEGHDYVVDRQSVL